MFKSFKVFIVLCSVLLCSFASKVQSKKTIKIVFYIDEVEQDIRKSQLFFVNKLDTLIGKMDSLNYLILPPGINNRKSYDIVFLSKTDTLTFKSINSDYLTPRQNFEWRFGVDNRPFNNLLGILSHNEYLKDSVTNKLTYWQFNPLETGDGFFFYNKIQN